jgi:hypothetical protein
MKLLAFALLSLISWASAQAAGVTITATGTITNDDSSGVTIFNCGSGGTAFTVNTGSTSTACTIGGFAFSNDRPNGFDVTGAGYAVTSGKAVLGDGGNGGHIGLGMMYSTVVNVQAFTATYTFIANGKNLALTFNNATNNMFGFNGRNFSAGAGCEAGFFQLADTDTPNNIFAVEFTQDQPTLVANDPTFTYSNVMIYSYRQSPCMPSWVFPDSWTNPTPAMTIPNKVSTSPVAMNSPSSTTLTTTGHEYSATVTYNGTDVTLDFYDITGGGSCPGVSCFSNTWTSVDIPTLVGANTAYVGLNMGCNLDCPQNNQITSFKYVDN